MLTAGSSVFLGALRNGLSFFKPEPTRETTPRFGAAGVSVGGATTSGVAGKACGSCAATTGTGGGCVDSELGAGRMGLKMGAFATTSGGFVATGRTAGAAATLRGATRGRD